MLQSKCTKRILQVVQIDTRDLEAINGSNIDSALANSAFKVVLAPSPNMADTPLWPCLIAEASASALNIQASDSLRQPFPSETGNTMPWPLEPASGKSFLQNDVISQFCSPLLRSLKGE